MRLLSLVVIFTAFTSLAFIVANQDSDTAAPGWPRWHPADNTMKRIDGPGKDLGAVLTGGGNEWAVIEAWTCGFAGPNDYGFASQGGHKQSADSGTYALKDFTQDFPPDWEVVAPAASSVPVYECSLIERVVPSPSHGYNTVTYRDGVGPYLVGRTAVYDPSQARSCPELLSCDIDTGTWTILGDLSSSQDNQADYDPVNDKIYYVKGSTHQVIEVDPSNATETVLASLSGTFNILDSSLTIDWQRRIALFRATRNVTYYRVINIDTGAVVMPNLPSFGLYNGTMAASILYCDALRGLGAFVFWNGGTTFYILEPPRDPLDASTQWDVNRINVRATNGTPTNPSTGWYKKMRYVKDTDLFVCQGGSVTAGVDPYYFVTRLAE